MLLKEYLLKATKICEERNLEIEAVKKLLIELKYQSAANLLLSMNDEFDDSLLGKINLYLDKKIPIQYILGYTYFYGMKVKVNENTLIPRDDTERLVDIAISEIKNNGYKSCLDLCTGSGIIALAIKKETNIEMIASDISIEALKIAKENARANDLDITFIHSDILENIDQDLDIIVSNPPYISYNEYVQDIVVANEPHLALFAEDDGLYFYKKILNEIKEKQKKIKMIIFEIGYNQAEAVFKIAKNLFVGCNVEVIKDYANLDRVIKIVI